MVSLPFLLLMLLLMSMSAAADKPQHQLHFRQGNSYHYHFRHRTTVSGTFSPGGMKTPPHVTLIEAKGTVTVVGNEPSDLVLCRLDVTGARMAVGVGFDQNEKTEQKEKFESTMTSRPFHFVQNRQGAVVGVLHDDGAEAWAVNLKRGFVSSIQVHAPDDVQRRDSDQTSPTAPVTVTIGEGTTHRVVSETSVSGTCDVTYEYTHHPTKGTLSMLSKFKTNKDCQDVASAGPDPTKSVDSSYRSKVKMHEEHAGVVKHAVIEEIVGGDALGSHTKGTARLLRVTAVIEDEADDSSSSSSSSERAAAAALLQHHEDMDEDVLLTTTTRQRRRKTLSMTFALREVRRHLHAHYGGSTTGARLTGLKYEQGEIVGAGGLLATSHHQHGTPRLHTEQSKRQHWRRRILESSAAAGTTFSSSSSSSTTSIPVPVAAYSLTGALDKDPFNDELLKQLRSAMDEAAASHTLAADIRLGEISLALEVDRTLQKMADKVEEVRSAEEEEWGIDGSPLRDTVHTAEPWRPSIRHLVKTVEQSVVPGSALDHLIAKQIWSTGTRLASEMTSIASVVRIRNGAIDILGSIATPGAQEVLLRKVAGGGGGEESDGVNDGKGSSAAADLTVDDEIRHEERKRAMLVLLQVEKPEDDTLLHLAKLADDCDDDVRLRADYGVSKKTGALYASKPEHLEHVRRHQQCLHALRIFGSLVHKDSKHHCVYRNNCGEEKDGERRTMRNFTKTIVDNVAHRLRTRQPRAVHIHNDGEDDEYDQQYQDDGVTLRPEHERRLAGGRRLRRRTTKRISSSVERDEMLSQLVCLGNAGATEHIDAVVRAATFGVGDVRDAALSALRRMDGDKVEATLWGFVE